MLALGSEDLRLRLNSDFNWLSNWDYFVSFTGFQFYVNLISDSP